VLRSYPPPNEGIMGAYGNDGPAAMPGGDVCYSEDVLARDENENAFP